MSRFFSSKYSELEPYVPGEQPSDTKYVKLNTNESPFPPSPEVIEAVSQSTRPLNLYSDPDNKKITQKLSEKFCVDPDQIIVTNGSDEILNFAFAAFCDDDHPAVFPDITYGFYKVFAAFERVPFVEIPLRDDFTIDTESLTSSKGTLFIANPNAPTGIALTHDQIEGIVSSDTSRVVVVDEAYVDFGAESAVDLVDKYDNLLVTQTFSKSRSLAGARLGFGIGNSALISDLHTIRCSTNPYNVNSLTTAAGIAALDNETQTIENCRIIAENRSFLSTALKGLGFILTDSLANFVYAKHPSISGLALYRELKKRGVLVRHFDAPRITDYNRITVGTKDQIEILTTKIEEILGGIK